MDTVVAASLAKHLMDQHGLTAAEWQFQFGSAKRIFGVCYFRRKLIRLSAPLVEINPEEQVRDTILHEIAHALVGHDNGHNHIWKMKAAAIGAIPERCDSLGKTAPRTRVGTCPSCGKQFHRYRIGHGLMHTTCRRQGLSSRLEWSVADLSK